MIYRFYSIRRHFSSHSKKQLKIEKNDSFKVYRSNDIYIIDRVAQRDS